MRFGYESSILEVAPTLVAGVIWCREIDNRTTVPAIDGLLATAEENIGTQFPEPVDIARHPAIRAWRDTYSQLGLTPNRYPCAAESLIRRVVGGNPVPRISPLVDLCNTASLEHAIPVAPFDLRLVEGNLVVRLATGNEVYRAISSDILEPIPGGEAVYADDTPEVLSRRWNWRQTAKGAMQPDSADILITTEAVHADGRETVTQALATLGVAIQNQLGGVIQTDLLDANNPWSPRTLKG
ncbi:phenylalanine--tRNA ligase beta subunit-related protein [soil metagenome]